MRSKADIGKTTTLFTGLCELFDKKFTTALMDIYSEALSGYSIEQIEYAINQAAIKCRFFPRPVELIEFITGGSTDIPDRAVSEAALVLTAVKRVGAYRSVSFRDPVTTAVIVFSFGGWVKLCNSLKSEDEKWFLKDFEKAYAAFSRQGMGVAGTLSGMIDMENSAKGIDTGLGCIQIEHSSRKNRHEPNAIPGSIRPVKALLPNIGRAIS